MINFNNKHVYDVDKNNVHISVFENGCDEGDVSSVAKTLISITYDTVYIFQ